MSRPGAPDRGPIIVSGKLLELVACGKFVSDGGGL